MIVKRILILGVFGMSALALQAEDKIIPYAQRTDLLNLIDQRTVQYKNKYPEGFDGILSPFVGKVTPEVGATPTWASASEADILNAVAPMIKPTGSVLQNGKYTLLFQHETVRDGGTLQIAFHGKQYLIYVVNITGAEYTLRLGKAELIRNFEIFNSGSVKYSK